jgi:hypothetical protein
MCGESIGTTRLHLREKKAGYAYGLESVCVLSIGSFASICENSMIIEQTIARSRRLLKL